MWNSSWYFALGASHWVQQSALAVRTEGVHVLSRGAACLPQTTCFQRWSWADVFWRLWQAACLCGRACHGVPDYTICAWENLGLTSHCIT